MDEKRNTIFLMDEETEQEVEFEVIDGVEVDGERFILVVPMDESEEETALILKDISVDHKEAIYKLVEDDNEFNKAVSYFMENNNDYDIEF